MANDFSNKISILSELWMNYRDDDNLKDFIEYNDLGLPLAYILFNEIATVAPESEMYINETYDLFIQSLGVEDIEYTSLDQILEKSAEK